MPRVMSENVVYPEQPEYGLMHCQTNGWKECRVVQSWKCSPVKVVVLLEDCCPDHRRGKRILVPGNMFKVMVIVDKGRASSSPRER